MRVVGRVRRLSHPYGRTPIFPRSGGLERAVRSGRSGLLPLPSVQNGRDRGPDPPKPHMMAASRRDRPGATIARAVHASPEWGPRPASVRSLRRRAVSKGATRTSQSVAHRPSRWARRRFAGPFCRPRALALHERLRLCRRDRARPVSGFVGSQTALGDTRARPRTFCSAAPLSMLWRATATPSASDGATPAITSAAAAFSSTASR